MPSRCSGRSLAVPMSIPRYSCSASALTISPPSSAARARARSDLPDAVGPTTVTSGARSMRAPYRPQHRVPSAGPEVLRGGVRQVFGRSAGSPAAPAPSSRGGGRVKPGSDPWAVLISLAHCLRLEVTSPNESTVQKDSADGLAPMSLQRVEESLTRHGYAFVEDEEHPDILRARFDDYRFQFMLTGEERGVLQTRGRWNHTVDVSRKVEIIKLCNEWNMNRIWPKVYVRRESEGLLGVYGELAADFRVGALDTQVDNAIACGLSTVIAFFRNLEERLGDELDDLDA